MTTEKFASCVGAIAKAMNTAYELSTAGQKEGTFKCPRCGSQLRFTALVPHKSSGQCSGACGVRWAN